MDGFIDITDAVGGVDVESDKAFVTDSGDVQVTRGTNHFDGAEALDYARTRRNLDGGDFERAAHHQALLLGYLRGLRDRRTRRGSWSTPPWLPWAASRATWRRPTSTAWPRPSPRSTPSG